MKFKYKSICAIALLCIAQFGYAKTDILVYQDQFEISGLNVSQSYVMKLALPNGEVKTVAINQAEIFAMNAEDIGLSTFADGLYKYELVAINAQNKSANNRTNSAPTFTNKSAAKPENISGVFTVKNGSVVIDSDEVTRDQVILDDLIVTGSACIGFDCVNGESFGFDTLRLKENNLRIKFQDTSASASFPSNDWQLTANDSSNGGLNKFSIDDIDGGRTPFTIEAGAPSHSLYVDDGGRLGLGTSTPVVDVHTVSGNTPTLRLEQDGSNGFTPQTWDVAGNEANFFIRDATNGSLLPFKIRPNTATDTIVMDSGGLNVMGTNFVVNNDGKVGVGTETPTNNLDITAATGNAGIALVNTEDSGASWKFANKNGTEFEISKAGTGGSEFRVTEAGAMTVGAGGAVANFAMDASGNITIQGALTQNSDINSKENISLVDTAEILNKVMNLPVSVWNYKFDDASVKHLGPMAQDFFKQFNLGGREDKIASIDTSGVALASIKELGNQLQNKDIQIDKLQADNMSLNNRLEALEKAIESLQQ